jgi:hypothetical protein
MDKTTKALLAAIALGVWVNGAIIWTRAQLETWPPVEFLLRVEAGMAGIRSDLQRLQR